MPEFRYHGTSLAGKPVQGILVAKNKREAKNLAERICAQKKIRFSGVQGRSVFKYVVQTAPGRKLKGEQKAYTREEVEKALRSMGYQVVDVQKKLFSLDTKPPAKDIAMFITLCADLLREKLPYDEILQLMANDTPNRVLRETIKEINHDLKEGKDGQTVFGKHSHVLGKFTSYMLAVASTSGNMAAIYESTAKFLERNEDFKKNLKSALVMPSIVVVVLFAAVIFYVAYIFPATAQMFVKFGIDLPPMTSATLALSEFLKSNIIWILLVIFGPVIAAVNFFKTKRGLYLMHKYMLKIPVIGPLLHKTSIEIFARVFHALYAGSGQAADVIRTAAEACGNTYMEAQIKEIAIPMMLKEGKGFVESLEKTGVFTQNALSRFKSGAESGALRQAALQLANYYEKETTYKMKNVVDLINIIIALFIMIVMTMLTLVSSETAVIKPKMQKMM